jgi:hypothetical protein
MTEWLLISLILVLPHLFTDIALWESLEIGLSFTALVKAYHPIRLVEGLHITQNEGNVPHYASIMKSPSC